MVKLIPNSINDEEDENGHTECIRKERLWLETKNRKSTQDDRTPTTTFYADVKLIFLEE
ncbi:12171_t:CDS:2 [Entrophospora sp. SA101]|nr:12171_t:CDS:2 [Entrophospora sp. SA101]CAJ0824881.1 17786_t:CDS:2 [Entrophospora sp. SA101]CAJ0830111.1 7269_t:CDS:2 [Entrophospora sp. SA101]